MTKLNKEYLITLRQWWWGKLKLQVFSGSIQLRAPGGIDQSCHWTRNNMFRCKDCLLSAPLRHCWPGSSWSWCCWPPGTWGGWLSTILTSGTRNWGRRWRRTRRTFWCCFSALTGEDEDCGDFFVWLKLCNTATAGCAADNFSDLFLAPR